MANGTSRRVSHNRGRASTLAATASAPAIPQPAVRSTPEHLDASDTLAGLARWRFDALAALTILLVTGLVAWHRLWLQNGLAHLDIPTYYLPWYAYMGEHLRALDIPGWNPHVLSGTAFAGDPQSGWMYAPAMLFFTFLDSVRAYEVFLIFHLVLAGLATYAFARIVGLGPIAAVIAAFAYEFGPLVNHISCCVIHVQLAAWIPVGLIGIELMMRATTWSGRAAAWCLAGFAISQMLAGWTGQGAYNGILLIGAYLAYRLLFTAIIGLVTWRRKLIRLVIDGAAILFLGVGLGAAGFLPRLDVVEHTNLAGGNYSGMETDLYSNGWRLLAFFNYMLSDDNGFRSLTFYLGAPVVALMAIAPFLARLRFGTPYWIALTALTSILTLHHTPVHAFMFAVFPRFEALHSHVPSRILAAQWIGPAMLAGIAAEMLLRETNRERVRRAAIVATSLWGLGILALVADRGGIRATTVLFALLTCAAVAAFALPSVWATRTAARGGVRPQAMLGALLILLVFLDPAGRGLVDTLITGQRNEVLALPTGAVDRDATPINAAETDPGGAGGFFQQQQAAGERFRYIGYDYSLYESGRGFPSTYREYYWLPEAQALLVNARAMPLEIEDAQGYNPMQFSNYSHALIFANHAEQNYHDAQFMAEGLDSPILDMLNVRYIVIPNEIAPGRPRPDLMAITATHPEVFRNETIRVLENPNALPRAWIVHDVMEATIDFSLLMIDSGLADPGELAFVEPGDAEIPLAEPADPSAEQVAVAYDGADQVLLDVTLQADGLLLVSETYDSGWNAYVDGEPVELRQANGVLQAVPVPAGAHEVKLVYEPASLRQGIVLSAGVAGLMLAMLAAYVWTRLGLPPARRSRRTATPA
jgi:hypothetical protein